MAQQKPQSKSRVSIKHLQIDKSQSRMLTLIVVTVVVVIFGLFATKALVTKGLYQRRVLHERKEVATQLKENYDSAKTLFEQYKVFFDQDPNILGGSVGGSGNLDGNNPRIVLDALPSTYDSPALATSIEKVLTGRNMVITSLSVTDDPVTNPDKPQAEPVIKPVIFSFIGRTTFKGATKVMQDFERSIRPFDLNSLEISGSDNSLLINVGMTTYYQPARSLDLKPTKEVK